MSEKPLTAKKAGLDPQTFLIADAGYNPYTGVIITRGQTVRSQPEIVKSMFLALQEGWRAYLDDPRPANDAMGKLNKTMDAATFAAAAEAQKPLIQPDEKMAIGSMTKQRWETLIRQLVDLKIVTEPLRAQECFRAE